MIYRWFKHGIYYDNGRILQNRDVDVTDIRDDIICIATDDPDCKSTLKELTVGSRLNTVIGDRRCNDVLGFSNNFILQPELTDPDCCPPAESSMSSDDVALVDVGERVILLREITGYPRPSIEMESMILPVGINRHYRYINYTLINTAKQHHYNLSLSVYVVTKDYIGKYCIYLKNKYGVVQVCHILMQATNDVINSSTGIVIIISVIGPFLLITVFIIGLVFVKKCFNSMAPNTRTNPLEHHYEQVTMQQFSTDLTTLNVPSNRTLLHDRESVITSSTQVFPEYIRPVSLIVNGLPHYDQQENLLHGVEDNSDNEDSGDDSVNDTNSASLCMNSPSSVPNVYEKLNKNTRIRQINLYKKLKW
ncbi:uncharacterized protein LOC130014107 [Patella vulgata]|uniref:uncharacterized protein LOC130014107 n=1 Tax=Patella vulgata TaxID=6465 RepID=UPI0024A8048C|nr:uncharacterized protein LOC130014107 [Patella vulgata]